MVLVDTFRVFDVKRAAIAAHLISHSFDSRTKWPEHFTDDQISVSLILIQNAEAFMMVVGDGKHTCSACGKEH